MRVLPLTPTSHLPAMAAASGGLWTCTECGKVCRSRSGLTRHIPIHKRHPRIGEPLDNSGRVYHPNLDGMLSPPPRRTSSDPFLKGNHVVQMESFSPLERRQLPHPQSPLTIGHLLSHALDSNLQRFYTQRRPSLMILSTDSLTSGVPH